MLRRSKNLLTLCCLPLFLNAGLFGNAPQAKKEEYCGLKPHPHRVGLRHIEGNGIGYNKGYTTLELFFSSPNTGDYVPFIDLRGHAFNDGRYAFNAGLGYRGLSGSRIWGGNVYYDWRKAPHRDYNQIGVGLESLGLTWDYRINGYIPVGSTKTPWYDTKFDKFSGHEMILRQKREFDMYGVHAEVAAHFGVYRGFEIYPAIGPYWFGNEGRNAYGGQFRLMAKYKEYVSLEGSISYDNIFKDIYQGQIAFNIPFGVRNPLNRCDRCAPSCCDLLTLRDRMIQPVVREEIIVVDKKHHNVVAVDPATGLPYYFLFVDNTSHSAGTYESPYNTLGTAIAVSNPNDIIYIYPGDGTSTGMNAGGYTLKNNQQLLGAGTVQTFSTQLGTINVPAQAVGMPIVTSPAGGAQSISSVINLANNNTISGLHLICTGPGTGIDLSTLPYAIGAPVDTSTYYPPILSTINNLTVINNLIEVNSGALGITLSNFEGIANVSNNVIDSPDLLGATGMYMMQSGVATNLIVGNQVAGFYGDYPNPITAGTGLSINCRTNGNVTSYFVNNHVSNCDVGIVANSYDNCNLKTVISNNTINNIAMVSSLLLEASNNSNNTVQLIGNTISNGAVILMDTNNSASMNALIENNTISNINRPNALLVFVQNTSNLDLTIRSNSILDSTLSANAVEIVDGRTAHETSTMSLVIQDNIMINSGDPAGAATGFGYGYFIGTEHTNGISNVVFTGNYSNNPVPDLFMSPWFNSSGTTLSTMCLRFQNNTNLSPGGYQFTQKPPGVFNLEPLIGNTPAAPVILDGSVINNVPPFYCGQ